MSKLTKITQGESLNLCLLNVKGMKLRVLRALAHKTYATRSELNKDTGIRISTLCSTLKRLEDEGWVRVAFDAKDDETDRMVAVYTTTCDAEERIHNVGGVVERHWLGE